MGWLIVLVLGLALAALTGCGYLLNLNLQQQNRIASLVAALEAAGDDAPEDWETASATARREVVIEIRNVLELAQRENRAAGLLHRVRPSMLDRIVHEEFVKQLREQLADEGVDAVVQVRRVYGVDGA